jgi:hypothetical protein
MTTRYLLSTVGIVFSIVSSNIHSPAFAQSQITQVSNWTCSYPSGAAGSSAQCKVNFKTPFGAKPDIIFTSVSASGGCNTDTYAFPDIEADGFTQTITHGRCLVQSASSYSGQYVAVGPALLSGTVTPSYIVLTVVYAPPGTNGGNSSSLVDYSAGSTAGTTTSASQSFKTSSSLSFQGSGGILGNGIGGGVQFQATQDVTDSQSLDIKKTTISDIKLKGPAHDGVDHDEDEIWFLLKPSVNLNLSAETAQWMLSPNNSNSAVQWVQVGQLNGNPNYSIGTGLAAQLASAGITPNQYQSIVSQHDPLACANYATCGNTNNGTTLPDPQRYALLNCDTPYEPPGTSTGSASPVVTWQQTGSTTATTGQTITNQYTVGLTISQTGDFLGFAQESLKDTTSWTWTDKSATSNQTSSVQSAAFNIGGPAYGFQGPSQLCVYSDVLYQTFAFVLVPPSSLQTALTGTLTDSAGKALPFQPVTLVEPGAQRTAITSAEGEYAFYGTVKFPASLQADGVAPKVVSPPASPLKVMLQRQ